jgi:prepilin-type N-terminal cleavage/methylation domain-containing protein
MKSMRRNGFTLTEIAIVMLILGLIITAALGPVGRMFQSSQSGTNQERLDAAREALITYAAINGRLPCPDRTGDGVEDQRANGDPATFGCAGNIYEGFLPWVTLGVPQADYWGTRWRYRVSAEFTRAGNSNAWICGPVANLSLANTSAPGCTPALNGSPPPGCTSSSSNPNSCTFEIADAGDIPVRDGQAARAGSVYLMNSTAVPATGAVAVILSHGQNRLGGTAQDGTNYAAPAGGSDEALNAPALGAIATGPRLAAVPFIVRTPLDGAQAGCSDSSAANLCNFDDQVAFVGANTLVSRILQSGLRLR